jgi:uncharacterized repeat protein (TIGR04138 family)
MAAHIDIDLGCIHCTYNLRGLTFDGRCPECGAKVWESAITDVRLSQDASYWQRAKRFEKLAADTGYPVDAFMLVADVMGGAVQDLKNQNDAQHIDARALIDYFQRFCVFYFNDENEAHDLLTGWKLTTSEDVGRVVFAMVDAGMLKREPNDQLSDFNALWTIDRLRGSFESES